MTNQLEPFTINEAEFIVQRLMNDRGYSVFAVLPQRYRDGVVATHEKLIIPVGYDGTKNPIMNIQVHVKIQPRDRPHIAKFSIGESVFSKEINFYEIILPCLLYKYRQQRFMPRCVLITEGRLVFEDVEKEGYKKRDIFNDFAFLVAAIVSLARFHCSTIVAEALLTQRFHKETTMISRYESSFVEMMFNTELSTIGKWYRVGVELTCILAERLFQSEQGELRGVLLRADDFVKPSDKYRNVVCHGDLRKENMAFLQTNPLRIKCIFMNFYLTRYAPLALDILQLLYLHTSKDFRAKHEEEILKTYQGKLNDTLVFFDNLPKDVKVTFPSFEQVMEAVNDLRLFGPATASVYISLSLIHCKYFTEFIKNPVPAGEFLIEGVLNACENKLIKNEKLKQQFSDLINETLEIHRKSCSGAQLKKEFS